MNDYLQQHPFQVFLVKNPQEMPEGLYYMLCGDEFHEPEVWKGKNIMATKIDIDSPEEKKFRLEDMKEAYIECTKTDGSKVNWEPKEIQ
jgi:hypothetical protein